MANRTATENIFTPVIEAVQARMNAGMTATEAWTHFTATLQAENLRQAECDAWLLTLGSAE